MVLRSLLVVLIGSVALSGVPSATRTGPVGRQLGQHVPQGVWPLRPTPDVVARFDPPDQPWLPGHRGVDLLGRPGQTVRSALPGQITYAGALAGRGVVVVAHGDTRTTYEPVTTLVRSGDEVGAGAPIGVLETAGSHCLPRTCLHWGWLRGELYLDPLALVGSGPIRLLPLWNQDAATPAPAAEPTPALLWTAWRPLDQARGCACW